MVAKFQAFSKFSKWLGKFQVFPGRVWTLHKVNPVVVDIGVNSQWPMPFLACLDKKEMEVYDNLIWQPSDLKVHVEEKTNKSILTHHVKIWYALLCPKPITQWCSLYLKNASCQGLQRMAVGQSTGWVEKV